MRAMRGLLAALNIIYGAKEERAFWHLHTLTLAFTCYGGIFLLAVLATIVTVLPVGPAPWNIMCRAPRDGRCFSSCLCSRWRCLSLWPVAPGSAMAVGQLGRGSSTVIWAIGSLLFSYYVSQVAQINVLFGSLGAVIIFFLWSYLTVLTMLLGAQVNAEMERQVDIERRP